MEEEVDMVSLIPLVQQYFLSSATFKKINAMRLITDHLTAQMINDALWFDIIQNIPRKELVGTVINLQQIINIVTRFELSHLACPHRSPSNPSCRLKN